MSMPKLNNKSRDDLATIVTVMHLLTPEETEKMSKAQLLTFLETVEQQTEATKPASDADAAPVKATTKRRTTTRQKKADDDAGETPAQDQSIKETAPAKDGEAAADQDSVAKKTTTRAAAAKKTTAKSRKTAAADEQQSAAADAAPVEAASTAAAPDAEPETKAKRTTASRTRTKAKTKTATEEAAAEQADAEQAEKAAAAEPAPAPRRRGRPRKVRPEEAEEAAVAKKAQPAAAETAEAAPPAAAPAAEEHVTAVTEAEATAKPAAAKKAATKAAAAKPAAEEATAPVVAEAATKPLETATASPDAADAGASGQAAVTEPAETAQAVDSPGRELQAEAEKTEAAKGHADTTESAGRPVIPATSSAELHTGVLEIMSDGYGFLRKENYLQGNKDIYVPPQYIRRFNLRSGDLVTGPCRAQREADRYQALYYIKEVNGMTPDKMIRRPAFDRLTPIYPEERYVLETTRTELSTRIIDLVAPIGKGQRGMIVSPPKAGKTILLQKIANAISQKNPEAKLIVLLIDERPEEVTDMQRSIKGEVVYSTFDKTPENHVKVTELVLERAMRLVELKQDVIILLDSITRMGRAYNLTINPTGRTLSGGLDPGALYGPKRFFGAARNIEHGGSLTIIATALIDTGSRMDEVIFEEFKGTGNMEVYLDRKLSEKRIFPAIDINRSGTRREELLLSPRELDAVWAIRKALGQLDTAAVTETIINLLLKTRDNNQFISSINVSFNDKNLFEAMRGNKQAGGGSGGAGHGGQQSGPQSGHSHY